MNFSKAELWQRFQKYYTEFPTLGLALDISRMNFPDDYLSTMKFPIQKAFIAMEELEKGGIANPDERRMVGHYWLRNPALAPTRTIREDIEDTVAAIKAFAAQVRDGIIQGARGPFKHLLVVGSRDLTLGPQFVSHALGHPTTDKLTVHFLDSTDPDGMDKVVSEIIMELGQTLCMVISRSGATRETRNSMLEVQAAYERTGLKFAGHAVAVTGRLSEVDKLAEDNGWLQRFPIWDWVGNQFAVLSAVGLLPAALQGIDIDAILAGAKACDDITRQTDVSRNPAAQLALMFCRACNGKVTKNMLIWPYKDRLELFSSYLQQLVLTSVSKEKDLNGNAVSQTIVVANTDSTSQYYHIQLLRKVIPNLFVIFFEVLQDRNGKSIAVDPGGVTSGDYWEGCMLGTSHILQKSGIESITLTIQNVSQPSIGALIALFERTVSLYASLINVNAYHQPSLGAGEKAVAAMIDLQHRILNYLAEKRGHALTSAQLASGIGAHDDYETVFKICEHVAANPDHGIRKNAGKTPFEATYQIAD